MVEPNKRAKDIIALRDRTLGQQSSFRTLWQSVSDLIFPQTYGITTKHAPGQELMSELFDTTAVEESENMTSGVTTNLFPAGQKFFKWKTPIGLEDDQDAIDYLYYLTEQQHEFIFNSNYVAQTSNTIQYWLTFGTGANFCDWTVKDGIRFRDYAIGTYQCMENSVGIIDTIIITVPMTARQIKQEVDNGNFTQTGPSVDMVLDRNQNIHDEFNVIQVVRPRKERDDTKVDNKNMAWESIYVQEKDQIVISEGGFPEFPFSVPRYSVLYREVYGRGRGTLMLPKVRMLNRLAKDYLEMSNKWVNPPKEVLESFEGQVDVTPGALNYVTERNTITSIDMASNGMYPVTRDMLEYYREGIRDGFYKSSFNPITPLKGDRRGSTEIIERLREGMKNLAKPFSRLFIELLTPQLTRSALLLIRNGAVETPPESLQGGDMGLRFINPLALALEDQQARGGQFWITALGEASEIFPGITDNVDADQWARDLGESLGVKSSHIKSVDERDEIRQQRAEQKAQEEKMQMAQIASDAYSKTTKAPEEGSAAEAELGGI